MCVYPYVCLCGRGGLVLETAQDATAATSHTPAHVLSPQRASTTQTAAAARRAWLSPIVRHAGRRLSTRPPSLFRPLSLSLSLSLSVLLSTRPATCLDPGMTAGANLKNFISVGPSLSLPMPTNPLSQPKATHWSSCQSWQIDTLARMHGRRAGLVVPNPPQFGVETCVLVPAQPSKGQGAWQTTGG
ncbi:hypothetical protein LX36DRAFT_165281 [Colletotrichum falcatum]|nr:hypothetical protein LX36DRAFT_165281 [Colletotrichum falcatum]